MFYVTSLNGLQSEPLINIGTDFKMEQSTDGTFTVSFSCFPENNPGYDILRSKSVVHIDDYEFIVEQYSDTGFSKTVVGINSFFENSKRRKIGFFSGSHTLNEHLAFALAGTGWQYIVEGNIGSISNFIDNFGDDNIVSLVEKITNYHQIEYIILPNNQIRFSKLIGGDYDFQYRYKYNVSDVVLKEDTSNLNTVIRGFGATDISAIYESPNVSVFGRLEAAPIKNDNFTDRFSLYNYLITQIQDVPELAIESNVPELTSRETGERIWLIYEPLNVEMQTRILKQTKTLLNGELITASVVFGNSLIKSSVDLLVSQKQSIDENKEEVSQAKVEYRSRFDVTDSRITLEVEQLDASIAAIDIKADQINLSVNNRITNEVAGIDIRATQIAIEVNNLDARTSSSINLLNNNINLKVDRGGSITDINLSPGNVTINAERINLNGAIWASGDITAGVNINVTTDINLGRRIRFNNDFTTISSSSGVIDIEAINGIVYTGQTHTFNGVVDFSNATVIGL